MKAVVRGNPIIVLDRKSLPRMSIFGITGRGDSERVLRIEHFGRRTIVLIDIFER